MNNIFCIVSAIGNQYGKFTYEQRFQQLVESIDSIKKYAPGSDIVIYDASEDLLPEADILKLSKLVNKIKLLYDNKYINFLKHNSKDPTPNKFEKKTVGEIEANVAFLEDLKNSSEKYNRVFKLTGRYKLNKNFNLNIHLSNKNRCVFLKKENWNGEEVFVIRLWSFDYNNLDVIYNLFKNIQNDTYTKMVETSILEVIEFNLTKHVDKFKIPYTTIKEIGVEGLMGQTGTPLFE